MLTDLCSVDDELLEDIVRYREHLHRYPELSQQEYKTAEWIQSELTHIGCEATRIGETGVVGVVRNGEGPVIAYRADMDGLPVKEESGLPFSSNETAQFQGNEVPVMHACGHDVHMAVALGIAQKLVQQRDSWRGTVVLIFQPAEEDATGAKQMVEDGLWRIVPKPDVIFGMHVMPYEAGRIYVPIGAAMSMGDSWSIRIKGRGAHGSQPERSIDPIVLASSTVVRLQTIVSREISPSETAVLTVGTFHAGIKENVIPEEATFTINVRTYDPAVRNRVLAAVRRVVSAEASASGAQEPEINVISEFPECYNDPDETEKTMNHLKAVMGGNGVVESKPHMASEDFGHFGRSIQTPSVFWFLGGTDRHDSGDPALVPVNHSPKFAPESNPTLGAGVTAGLASILSRLRNY